jgi:sulfur-carrier protein
MPVTVYLSTHIRAYTGGVAEVEAEGVNLAELMLALEARYPGIRFRVIDEQDRIRSHINFFVGGELVRDLRHPIPPGQPVHILASLSGG